MNIETLFQTIKEKRLRLTKTRRAVLELFSSTHTPLSVPHILAVLAQQKLRVNKTTVYRELETLETVGIVKSIQLQDRKQYFELASRDHHHHLVCLQCEQIEDVDVNEGELVREAHKASERKQFTILRHSLEFFGLCRQCQTLAGC